MTITCNKVGVWKVDDAYKKVLSDYWRYCIKFDSGTLWSWGCNNAGQIGNSSKTYRSSPIQIPGTQWNFVSSGNTQNLAVKADCTLWGWGSNLAGRLGDNTSIYRSSPVQIPGTSWVFCEGVASGGTHTLALKTNGTLWSWGGNSSGQLGNGARSDISSPIQIPGNSWTKICAGLAGFSLGLKSNGTLWSWGDAGCGVLGINDPINSVCSPNQIPGTNWSDISTQGTHALALKTDGTLWSWGYNGKGHLGAGDIIHRSSPTQVPGTSWKDISGSICHNLALKTDGTLWAWGNNDNGRLGDNTSTINRSSPVQVTGTQWTDIASGGYISMALKTDNTFWVWGSGSNGALGNNSSSSSSSPIQIPGLWSAISGGQSTSTARKLA